MNRDLPSLSEAKEQAKQLRADLAKQGKEIGHARALELLAHQAGFRDWNAFFAAIGTRPPEGWMPGKRVQGRYISQPFMATVVSVEMQRPGWFRLALELDTAVDVVTFDSFSSFRKHVRGVVGPRGISRERTSDGAPQLVLLSGADVPVTGA
ncbi:MAG: hypothetical protein JKX69_13735 [Rhodobacteraceae bacterium]|nr:hypothetical protein [Paracoccaceae bacterium]